MKKNFLKHLRIIWAITSKDLIDAIKNKNVISILISSLFIVLVYKYLPALTMGDGPPALLVYDPGNTQFVDALWDSPAVDLYTYESEDDMKYYLSNGEVPELGLVVPNDLDSLLQAGNLIELQGYALDVFSEDQIYELKRAMQDEFEYLMEQPVSISIDLISLQPESGGVAILPAMGFVFVTLMVGLMVIPHMMIEERQQRTIDALMISPAAPSHIVIGKALTGITYTILIMLIALAFNSSLIHHGWMFVLGGLIGALFSISVGILLGTLIESRQQLTLWGWVVLIPLFLPMMFTLLDDLFPEWLVNILRWIPTSAMLRVFRTSMSGTAPLEYFAPQLGSILIFAIVFFIIDAWLVRRLDQ